MDALTVNLMTGLALLALISLASLRRVPQGFTFTVDRLGQFHRTLAPGIHFILPFVDRVTHRINMLGRALLVHCESLETKDACRVIADGTIYLQILDPRKVTGRLDTLDDAARSLIETTAREMVLQLTLESLHHRTASEINSWLLGLLNQSSNQWGVRITRIDLDFIDPD
jgi:regulator of protease activity HflC (stomatin/prohibitin superfamily)